MEEMGRLLSGFADCICCGRGNRYQSADAWMNQPLNIFQPRSTATLEDLLEKSSRAREAVWQQLGSLEPLVLSHLVSPTLSGGPKWPALRQAFRLVRRPNGNVILASDGLSDPFDDITLGTYHITTKSSLTQCSSYTHGIYNRQKSPCCGPALKCTPRFEHAGDTLQMGVTAFAQEQNAFCR